MDGLIANIRAAIDEDERRAQTAAGEALFDGTGIVDSAYTEGTRRVVLPSHLATHIARHDPARVLAMVAAHREILDWCEASIASGGPLPEGVSEGRDQDEIERDRAIGEEARHVLGVLAKGYGIDVEA